MFLILSRFETNELLWIEGLTIETADSCGGNGKLICIRLILNEVIDDHRYC